MLHGQKRWRWWRFSLRTALGVITIICLFLGGYVKQVRDQKLATDIVRGWGATVLLDYQWEYERARKNSANRLAPVPPNFHKLRERFGEDYFSNVVAISIPYHLNGNIDLGVLVAFKKLRDLNLSGAHVVENGLQKLPAFSHLESLRLADTDVTDHDIRWLIQLPRLTTLSLSGTRITDAGLLQLAQKESLTKVDIRDTMVTQQGVDHLRLVLPNCKVIASKPATRSGLKW